MTRSTTTMAKRSRDTTAPGRRLYRLLERSVLHYPESLVLELEQQVWARPGQVVEFDDVLWELTSGQRHKLEAIDERTYDSARAEGRAWDEERMPDRVKRHVRAAREADHAAPASTRGGPSTSTIGTTVNKAAPPTSSPPNRRAADVEAALAQLDGGDE